MSFMVGKNLVFIDSMQVMNFNLAKVLGEIFNYLSQEFSKKSRTGKSKMTLSI